MMSALTRVPMVAEITVHEQLWWFVARSGGIVALALAAASVIWGLLLTTRAAGDKPRPAWLLDLHKFLGALSVVFTAVHVIALMLDNYVSFGLTDIFVPMASSWQPGPVAWGIVAMYLLVAVQASSMMMRKLPRKLWRAIHMLSFGVFGAGVVHGFTAGTDASNPVYVGVSVAAIIVTVFLTTYRVLAPGRGR
ncbi:MAG: ferric reductase-like transmembrane domain-containing protein [Acidimicrobiales bacterium]